MLRNTKTKLFLILLLIITLITPFCFAENETANTIDDANIAEETNPEENEENTEDSIEYEEEPEDDIVDDEENLNPDENSQAQSNQDVHEGDLYLTGNDITMDKIVNGNVYIMGNNVTITGQVAGNLFIGANKVEFNDAYVEAAAYIFANTVNFQAVASDLYICCNSLEIPNNYGVYRNLRCYSNSLTLLGIVGRDAFCEINSLTLSKDENNGTIYGDFNYSSSSEIEIPEGSVQGEVKYSKLMKNDSNKVSDYIFSAFCAIIFTLVIYGLASLFTKGSIEKCTKITAKKFLPAFGIGIASLVLVPVVSIILVITSVGVPVACALLVFYGLLISLATSIFSISIAGIIYDKLKLSNRWLKVLLVAIVALLVYVIGIIPYVSILTILFVILGFGTLIMNMLFKNIKFENETK